MLLQFQGILIETEICDWWQNNNDIAVLLLLISVM